MFLRYCFDQKYMDGFPLMLVKEDESFKEPYTEAELKKLLEQPHGNSWAEWRTWAAINLLVATGVRASTVVNIKICDVDFEHNIIRLRKLKNRKQQFVPMSSSLNAALSLYVHLKVPSQKHKKSRSSKLVTRSGPQGISFCFYF